MVVIRLARGGAKKRPFYHIVAADKRNPRDGRNIEQIGFYNPVARGAETGLYIDLDRVEYWKSVGAQPSDRIKFLLKKYQKQLIEKEAEAEKAAQAPEKAEAPAVEAEPKQEQAVQAQEETSTETQEETGSNDTTENQEQKSQTEAGE